MVDFSIWQVADHSYLLIDRLANYQAILPNKQAKASWACRQLLANFQQNHALVAPLYEQGFPYYFIYQQTKYFVSFSHSREQIAVLISPCQNIGVDIEDKMISYQVAERFFHQAELFWLNSLSKSKQNTAMSLLWTLKESLIKTGLKADSLVKGLGKNIFDEVPQQHLESLLLDNCWQIHLSDKTFGFLTAYRCGFVVFHKNHT